VDRSPAVDVAKQHKNGTGEEWVVLTTGYRAKLRPAPALLIQEAQAKIKNPSVPLQTIEGRDQPVENPLDPDYIEAVQAAQEKRAAAAFDIMVLFGLDLADPIPTDEGWIKKLRFLEKRGQLDLSGYDLEDEMDREFIFRKFVVVGSDDLLLLAQNAGLRERDLQQARDNFRSSEERGSDQELPAAA
jgi:hypothetical protein